MVKFWSFPRTICNKIEYKPIGYTVQLNHLKESKELKRTKINVKPSQSHLLFNFKYSWMILHFYCTLSHWNGGQHVNLLLNEPMFSSLTQTVHNGVRICRVIWVICLSPSPRGNCGIKLWQLVLMPCQPKHSFHVSCVLCSPFPLSRSLPPAKELETRERMEK